MSWHLPELDWQTIANELDREGYACVGSLLHSSECADLVALYDSNSSNFRSIVNMARYNFGRGEYKYFGYPLPDLVQSLREDFFAPLAAIANTWSERLGSGTHWADSWSEFFNRCQAAGQCRPTPLLLRYGQDDYNCLHQDLYGDVYFPLQLIVLLSEPGLDFDGGELMLVEQRPRMQSRAMVVPLTAGDAVIIPVRDRPREGRLRSHRVQMRHGVSRIRRGSRYSLGVIFHDAA